MSCLTKVGVQLRAAVCILMSIAAAASDSAAMPGHHWKFATVDGKDMYCWISVERRAAPEIEIDGCTQFSEEVKTIKRCYRLSTFTTFEEEEQSHLFTYTSTKHVNICDPLGCGKPVKFSEGDESVFANITRSELTFHKFENANGSVRKFETSINTGLAPNGDWVVGQGEHTSCF